MACEFKFQGKYLTKEQALDRIKEQNIYVKGEETQARKWLNEKLGLTEKEVSFVKGLIDGKAFGRFLSDGKILLSDKFEQGSEFHEAFHRVFNNYLTPGERIALRKEFYSRTDKDKVLSNVKEKYPDLNTDDLIEEALAEEFRDYVLSDGTFKFANKEQGSLFQRFLNFLKNLVGKLQGKAFTQEQLFDKINNAGYKGRSITGYSNIAKDRRITFQGRELDELQSQALMRGTLFLFTKKLVDNNIDFYDVASQIIDLKDFFLEDTFGEPILQTLLNEGGLVDGAAFDMLYDMHENDNFGNFFTSFKDYLNSFRIKLSNQDSPLTQDQKDSEDVKEDEFGNQEESKSDLSIRASIEIDPYQSISNQIKLILATAPKLDKSGKPVLNEVGLPEGEDPQFVYTMLSQTLAGIPADNDVFLERMLDLTSKFPFLEDIIYKVGLDKDIGDFSNSLNDVNKLKLVNDFIQAFAKARYKYNITMISEDGTRIYSSDAEVETSVKKLRNTWQSDFNQKNINNFEKFKRDITNLPDKLSTDANIADFIKVLGINVEEAYAQQKDIKDSITYLYSKIKEGIKTKDEKDFLKLFTESKDGFNVSGALAKIANSIATDNTFVNLQHYNSEGKLVYGISLNSNFSVVADNLNYIVNKHSTPEAREKALREEMPHLFTAYSTNSRLIKGLIQGNNIKIGIADGVKDQSGDGTSTSDLSPSMRLVQVLNETLFGTYHFIQTGDRGTVNNFEFLKNGERQLFIKGAGEKQILQETFLGYLKDEVETHKEIAKNGSVFSNVQDRNKAYGLRFFADVFTKAEQSTLFNSEDLDAELAKPVYIQKIEAFLQKKAKVYQKDLENAGILQVYKDRVIGISTELNEKFNLTSADDILYYSFVNQVIANIEQTKVFFGDLAAFKSPDDIFKRLSQFNSTRKVSINSVLNNDYIARTNDVNPIKLSDGTTLNYNTVVNGDYSRAKETVLLDGNTRETEKVYEEIKDIAKKSFKKDYPKEGEDFIDALADSFADHYLKYEEGDGASWVNIYFYREMMLKSGAWDKVDENIWRKVVAGENITSSEAIRLTMQKPNYVGPTENSTFSMANRKTSYMPLIPQMIKGSNLEALHEKMLKEGVDIVHLDSAAKFGAKGKEGGKLESIYKDGKLNLGDWITNELDWKYFGIQLDMNREAKGKISQATQATKNMLHNVFEGGIPRDYTGKDWNYDKRLWSTYSDEQQKKISELAHYTYQYNKLLNTIIDKDIADLKADIDYRDGKINNWTAFKKLLVEQAKDRSSSDNVLTSIDLFINEDGKAVPINTLSTKDKVEQIIMSVVTNRVIKQKRFGDVIPQGTVRGLEEKGYTREYDSKNKAYFASDKLSFRDSKGRTEFAVPLPNELINYVSKLEGKDFEEKLNNFNTNIDTHMDESLRIFHGLRIPNQSYASNTPGFIKYYLEPTINTIIVPSSFVKQTGSDFDIDKLFNYFKSFKVKDGKINEVKFFGEFNKEGIQNKLIDITHALLLHPLNLRQLYAATDDSYLKEELLQKVLKAKGATKDEKSGLYIAPGNKVSITDVFLPSTSSKKFKDFFGSKAGLGMVARHIPNHAITQIKDIRISPEFKTWFEDNNNSLADIKEATGKWITDVLSAYLSGNVDAGKNPYLPEIGINKDTQDIATMLLRRGASYEQISFFLSQPVIQKYLQFRAINESDVVKKTGRGKFKDGKKIGGLELNNTDVVRETLQWFDIKNEVPVGLTKQVNSKAYLDGVTTKHTDKSLLDGLALYNGDFDITTGLNLSDKDKENQFRMLMEYINYTEQSRKFNNFIKMSNPDTNNDKDITEALLTNTEAGVVIEEGFIQDFQSKWLNQDDAFGGILMPYMEAQKIKAAFKDLDLIYKNPAIRLALSVTRDKIVPFFKKKEGKRLEKLNKAIHDDLILSVIQTKLKDMGMSIKSSIHGENTVAKQIEVIKTNPEHPLYGNKFLDIIAPLVGNTTIGKATYDNFQPWTKKLNAYAVDLYTDELQKIRDEDKPLFDAIVVGNFLQAGLGNSPFQINQIIPAELYHNLTSILLEDFNPSEEDLNIFAKEFALNRTNLLTYVSPEELAFDEGQTPDIYKSKYKDEVVVFIDGKSYTPQGNGYNILQYGIQKEGLNLFGEDMFDDREQEVIEQPIQNKEGIDFVFEQSPELASIGTQEQYSQYLNTIFPDSKVKDIAWRADKRINLTPQTTVDDYTQVYVNGVYYSTSVEYVKKYNETLKGEIYPTILDIKNPAEIKSKPDIERLGRNKEEFEKINDLKYKDNPKDSLIFDNFIYKTEDKYGEVGREIVVFEPGQIHILGSKQDIERFKKFVEQPINKEIKPNEEVIQLPYFRTNRKKGNVEILPNSEGYFAENQFGKGYYISLDKPYVDNSHYEGGKQNASLKQGVLSINPNEVIDLSELIIPTNNKKEKDIKDIFENGDRNIPLEKRFLNKGYKAAIRVVDGRALEMIIYDLNLANKLIKEQSEFKGNIGDFYKGGKYYNPNYSKLKITPEQENLLKEFKETHTKEEYAEILENLKYFDENQKLIHKDIFNLNQPTEIKPKIDSSKKIEDLVSNYLLNELKKYNVKVEYNDSQLATQKVNAYYSSSNNTIYLPSKLTDLNISLVEEETIHAILNNIYKRKGKRNSDVNTNYAELRTSQGRSPYNAGSIDGFETSLKSFLKTIEKEFEKQKSKLSELEDDVISDILASANIQDIEELVSKGLSSYPFMDFLQSLDSTNKEKKHESSKNGTIWAEIINDNYNDVEGTELGHFLYILEENLSAEYDSKLNDFVYDKADLQTQEQPIVEDNKELTKEEADWLYDNIRPITERYDSSTLYDSIDPTLKTPLIFKDTKVTAIQPDAGGKSDIWFERPSGKWLLNIDELKGKEHLKLGKINDKGSYYIQQLSEQQLQKIIDDSGLRPLIDSIYKDTMIPQPPSRLEQFEIQNKLQQKYGLKRTYKDIYNEMNSQDDVVFSKVNESKAAKVVPVNGTVEHFKKAVGLNSKEINSARQSEIQRKVKIYNNRNSTNFGVKWQPLRPGTYAYTIVGGTSGEESAVKTVKPVTPTLFGDFNIDNVANELGLDKNCN